MNLHCKNDAVFGVCKPTCFNQNMLTTNNNKLCSNTHIWYSIY